MTLSAFNPLGRFTGLAEVYANCRPSYPTAALDWVWNHCRLSPPSLLIDVGSGTGILSRQLAMRGFRVIGIEPNADMRARAEAEALPPGPAPTYQDGRAEATGLADGVAAAVFAGQAFHWFQPEATLCEFRRVLHTGGWVVLLWNERDETDPFTAAYGDVIRTAPQARVMEDTRARSGAALLASPLFEEGVERTFANEQHLTEEAMLGRAFSMSYAPREPAAVETFVASLRQVFLRFQNDGAVKLRYEARVVLARRRRG